MNEGGADEMQVISSTDCQLNVLFDKSRLDDIVKRDALCQKAMNPEMIYSIKGDMEGAQERKLQPHFVSDFFIEAFDHFKGSCRPRESGCYEIKKIPRDTKERHVQLETEGKCNQSIADSYHRICFDKIGED